MSCDIAVVGGGIVGLATAMALLDRHPGARVVVLEKEDRVAAHQTGRNSGVIHSGIYYPPGSRKARYALDGNRELPAFCARYGIRHEVCGKLIVATEERELPLLAALEERGRGHGIPVRRLGPAEIHDFEPHGAGLAALHVPVTGIVDFAAVAAQYARLVMEQGGEVRLGTRVTGVERGARTTILATSQDSVEARFVVNCGGLFADRLARMDGAELESRIVPFRGEYYELVPERRFLVRNLIYPVPDPAFPFLGVHFTRGVDGSVHCGPNAVLALAREGYSWGAVRPRDLWDTVSYPGFWRLAARHWLAGTREVVRSISASAFTRSLRRLVPEVRREDLVPAVAGVRAQALRPDGRLVDDFLIVRGRRSVHVLNAPSPAATASLPIGRAVAAEVPAPAEL